jgi:hypothetical protein
VEHKVVCVGYAVAAQYLLQSVGICCGQVVSQTHSWNVVKLGKYCYYLDVTWGDPSTTTTGDQFKNVVGYSYFCVPFKENLFGSDEKTRLPHPEIFGDVEEFRATKHEYCRVHGGYLTSYDEDQIVRAIVAAVKEKPFERMTPGVSFRCASKPLYDMVIRDLWTKGGIWNVIAKARAILESEKKKDKKALKLLERKLQLHPSSNLAFQIIFLEE